MKFCVSHFVNKLPKVQCKSNTVKQNSRNKYFQDFAVQLPVKMKIRVKTLYHSDNAPGTKNYLAQNAEQFKN